MQVTFRNKSSEFAACNVKVSLAAEGEESNLTFGRTSEYFEKVQPGKAITFTEELRIQTNAPQGNVPVKFSFEYEDEKGTAYMGTESLVLQIRQPARVSLSNCSIPSSVYSTDTISTDMQILNLGKAPVYNVRVWQRGPGFSRCRRFMQVLWRQDRAYRAAWNSMQGQKIWNPSTIHSREQMRKSTGK